MGDTDRTVGAARLRGGAPGEERVADDRLTAVPLRAVEEPSVEAGERAASTLNARRPAMAAGVASSESVDRTSAIGIRSVPVAYPQDLVGKAVQLSVPRTPFVGPNPNPILTGHAPDLSVAVFDYVASRPGIGGAPTVPPRFTNRNARWDISFLEYLPGEVTTVRLQRPVLTGPMSGCYLFRYVVGGPRIAHVGTHDLGADAPLSLRAKANWRAYIAQSNALQVMGATPADFYSAHERANAQVGKLGGVPQVYGLFDPGGESYAVLLAPVGSDLTTQKDLMIFIAIKTMHLQPWSAIAALRTFR